MMEPLWITPLHSKQSSVTQLKSLQAKNIHVIFRGQTIPQRIIIEVRAQESKSEAIPRSDHSTTTISFIEADEPASCTLAEGGAKDSEGTTVTLTTGPSSKKT